MNWFINFAVCTRMDDVLIISFEESEIHERITHLYNILSDTICIVCRSYNIS